MEDATALAAKVLQLEREVSDGQSEVAVAALVKENMVDLERQKQAADEELATMTQLLSEAHDEAASTRTHYEHEVAKAKAMLDQTHQENQELKIQLKLAGAGDGSLVDKDTLLGGAAVLSDATKSFARRVKSNLQTAVIGPGPKDMDEGMKRAYEDAEMLKAIVVPLEEQIGALKEKLRDTDALLREQESRQANGLTGGGDALAEWLKGKSMDEAKSALLKKADDQEMDLEKESAQKGDNIYIELLSARYSLLNAELIASRKDQTEMVSLLEKERLANKRLKQDSVINSSDMIRVQREHLAEVMRIQALLTEEQKVELVKTPPSPTSTGAAAAALTTSNNCSTSSEAETTSSADDPDEDSNSFGGATRLVSNVEWDEMQKELVKVRALLGVGAGDSVVGSDQYRKLQGELIEHKKGKAGLQKTLDKMKEEMREEGVYRKEVEEKWNERAEQHKSETDTLNKHVQEQEGLLEQLRVSYTTMYEATRTDLQSLTADREKVVRELKRLQDETDKLTGKHLVKADEMQNEVINLPEQTEDMHLLLLRYREDLIIEKTAKEHLEEKLQSQVGFLKTQLAGEVQSKETITDELTSEIEALRERLGRYKAFKVELEGEQSRVKELLESGQKQQAAQAALQGEVRTLKADKEATAAKVYEMKNRISNLQLELDNSVAVQTDFVRLSQSLQIELEKIRQAEKEVRWQHEDDIHSCQGCKLSLTANKRKHHCRHCGRIFCSDCVSKHAPSGPSQRPAKVCDVCHTLLNQNSAPYFSTEAPQNT